MKKRLIILCFFTLFSSIAAKKIDMLKMQQKIIENEIKRHEDYKLLEKSDINYFQLKNSLIHKKMDIFEEEKKIRIEQIKIKTNKERHTKSKEMFVTSWQEYKNRFKIAKKSKDRISKFELEEIEYFVDYFTNEIIIIDREQEYLNKRWLRYKYDFPKDFSVKISKKEKMIKNLYDNLIKILETRLIIFEKEERGKKEIERINNELQAIKYEKATMLEEIEFEKLEKRKEFLNETGNLEVLKKNLRVKKKRLDILKNQKRRGYVSRNDVFEEEAEYILLYIQSLDLENKIKILELELEKIN